MVAIDVSNYQPRDLSALIATYNPEHVIVRLTQTIEIAGGRAHALAQLESVRENNRRPGGYVWLYRGVNARSQVMDAINLANEAAVILPVLWLDIESYKDAQGRVTIPDLYSIEQAARACLDDGVTPGIYTSLGEWSRITDQVTDLRAYPLWQAGYLERRRPAIESIGLFGGWNRDSLWGHQWTDTPIDQSVFKAKAMGR